MIMLRALGWARQRAALRARRPGLASVGIGSARSATPGRRFLSSSSLSVEALPIIDLEPVLTSTGAERDAHRARIAEELLDAASTTGFLYVVGHGIEQEVFDKAYESLEQFFALQLKEKMTIHVSTGDGLKGYSALYEQGGYGVDETDMRAGEELGAGAEAETEALMDAKGQQLRPPRGTACTDSPLLGPPNTEVFHMGPELSSSDPAYCETFFAPNRWPKAEEFRENMERYHASVLGLSDELFPLFARSLDLDETYFDKLVDKGMDSMNAVHYPALPSSERERGQLGIGEHTDYECFTLLSQNGISGLEILSECSDGDGGEPEMRWMRVPPLTGAFVVNVGDLLARWSDDRFKSTVHRAVNNNEGLSRLSIAYFRCCNFDTRIESLVAEEGQGKYPLVVAGEHMLKRIGEANANEVV